MNTMRVIELYLQF